MQLELERSSGAMPVISIAMLSFGCNARVHSGAMPMFFRVHCPVSGAMPNNLLGAMPTNLKGATLIAHRVHLGLVHHARRLLFRLVLIVDVLLDVVLELGMHSGLIAVWVM